MNQDSLHCRGGVQRGSVQLSEKASAQVLRRLALALARPRLALCFLAVDCQPCAERGDEERADTVGPRIGRLVGLRVDQQRLADVVPGERNLGIRGRNMFGPEIARVAGLLERRVDHGDRQIPSAPD